MNIKLQNIHTVPPDRGSYIISQGRVIMFRILGRAGDHEDASNLDLLESWDQIGKQTPLIVCITKPIQKHTRTTEWIQEPRVVIAMLFSLLYISVWSWCYLPVSLRKSLFTIYRPFAPFPPLWTCLVHPPWLRRLMIATYLVYTPFCLAWWVHS